MQTSQNALDLIEHAEGFREDAYECSAGVWTIGVGSTRWEDGSPVQEGDVITRVEAEMLLKTYVRVMVEPALDRLFSVQLNWNQRDALATFIYNFGETKVSKYSLRGLINDNADWLTICEKWIEYVYSDGKKQLGLYRRRIAEARLYYGLSWEKGFEANWNDHHKLLFDAVRRQHDDGLFIPVPDVKPAEKPLAPSASSPPAPVEDEAGPVEKSTAPVPEPVASEPIEQEAEPVAHEVFKTVDPHEPVVIPKPSAKVPYGDVDPMADPKDMIRSKRFWGMLIMIVARFSLFGTVVQTALGEVTKDPILFEAATAGLAMGALWFVDVAGQYVHRWGQKDAKALLK